MGRGEHPRRGTAVLCTRAPAESRRLLLRLRRAATAGCVESHADHGGSRERPRVPQHESVHDAPGVRARLRTIRRESSGPHCRHGPHGLSAHRVRGAAMRVVALAALLLALPAFAQKFDDSITVNVVDVPVYVERFGVPIKGLTRDAFELFVDGKPHPIEYFDVLEERRGADADAKLPAGLKRRRLTVLLFDLASSPHALQRSREAALKYVAGGAKEDSWAVATIGRSSVRFVAAFTTDHVAVQRAIGTLTPSASHDPFRVATLDTERSSWAKSIRGAEAGSGGFGDVWGDDLAPGGIGVSTAAANAVAFEQTVKQMAAMNDEALNIGFIESLAALAERLAPLEGVKQVVLLSDRRTDDDNEGPLLQRATRLHERFRSAGVILD